MAFDMVWEPGGVYKRFWGMVTFEEYARSQELVLGDARTDELDYVINDLLAIDGYAFTPEQAEYVAAFNRGTSLSNPRLQVAYVTRDPKIIALLQSLVALSSLGLLHFPTLEEARAWAQSIRRG